MALVRQDSEGIYVIVSGWIARPLTAETTHPRALGFPRTGTKLAVGDKPRASHSGGPTARVGGELWFIDRESGTCPSPAVPPSPPPGRKAPPAPGTGARLRPRPHIPPPGKKPPHTSGVAPIAPASGGDDPDQLLAGFRALQRDIAAEIAQYSADEDRVVPADEAADHHDRLADLYEQASDLMAALDTHLTAGGRHPAAWAIHTSRS
ncbi:hypothetical protein [Nocardia wallacei]|uniref:hypothetical protein n=1 Tax=Nocardia wallacei TaxID=480035 RepID=UPI002454969C|nr:hypothetical protein [Nocardia wallacei]